jgi:hypothetical protein
MTPVTSPVRQHLLIIVDADRADLLPRLQAQFADALVILDRRGGDRRQTSRPVPVERREGGDRRQPSTWSEELCRMDGYRIVCRVRDNPAQLGPDVTVTDHQQVLPKS